MELSSTMHYVTDATYVGGYRIMVRFENAESKLVDLEEHLTGPIFRPLKNLAYFKLFTVNRDINTIAWPNKADFAPEFLYEIGQSFDPRDG